MIRKLPQYKEIAWFLLAKMIYIDGLNTLFAFGGIYAAGQFGMDMAEVLIFGILLNITAGIGAFGFAWIDDIFGSRRTIIVSLLAVLIVGFCLVIITDKMWFYILGMMIGLFFGPIQSASRTMLVRLSPPEMISEFLAFIPWRVKQPHFWGQLC
ncbi:MAG: MFS transporter [Rhodospirillaceae bacterium]|nr:MFS transporter [Rhodospirillaceae bacterium]